MGWKSLAAILVMFAAAQVIGVAFQQVVFEIERQERGGEFSKQASESLSPYRGSELPLLALPLIFVAAIYFYLFVFRFKIAVNFVKLGIYAISILSFAMVMQILAAFALSALPLNTSPDFIMVQNINFLLSIAVPSVLLILGKYKAQLNNLLGVCLCAFIGFGLAAYFTFWTALALLFFIALLDYYFVLKNRKIPRIVEALEKYDLPFALESSAGGEKVMVAQKAEKRIDGYALGFGDLIFATALSVSAFVDKDTLAAAIMVLTTTLSLGAFMLLLEKKDTPMPAVPAIFVGGAVGALLIALVQLLWKRIL